MSEKYRIIYDTDMDTDCDDAGAFAMLLEAHLAKKAEILGVVADSVSPHAAPCCEKIARYYGVNVPIGTVFSDNYHSTAAEEARFAEYRRHSGHCLSEGKSYNAYFAEEIGKKDKDYPSAVSVYRKLLSEAEDHSVTVLCVGMLTAIAEALDSVPDNISPLSGVELFRKKVKCVVTMGDPHKTDDFNWAMDACGAEQFFALCPSPVYASAAGADVLTGGHLSTVLPEEHPIRRAYEIWLGGKNRARASWDLIAALFAMQPDTPYLSCRDLGDGLYSASEKRFYKKETGGRTVKEIVLNCTPSQMAEYLDGYMLGKFDMARHSVLPIREN